MRGLRRDRDARMEEEMRFHLDMLIARNVQRGMSAEEARRAALVAQFTVLLGQVIDVARSQGVGLDSFVHRWVNRALRRDPSTRPAGPPSSARRGL